MRVTRIMLAAGALAALGAAVVAMQATGTTPASNGPIAYAHPVAGKRTTFAISVISPDGSGVRQLTRPAAGTIDGQPDWSPDGSILAFERCAQHCEIYTVNANGGGLRRRGPHCSRRKASGCDDRLGPVWSPDGRSIVFTRDFGHVKTGRPFGPRGQIAHSELFLMDAGGGHLRRITHLTASRAYSADLGRATWSPDGARLVFNVAKSRRGKPPLGRALFTVRVDGSGLKRLTPWKLHTGEHPDFSPDGRQILFVAGARGSHDRGGNLYTVHPDGSALTQLTHGGRSGLVAAGSYSPDGASLAFVQLRPHEQFLTSLFVMSTDGTGLREVTKPAAVADPDWGAGPAG